MISRDPTTVAPAQLALMLRAWSNGDRPRESAVGLLIAHECWLRRRDFLTRLVDVMDSGRGPRSRVVPVASIDWDAVPDFVERVPASHGELAVLRFAASLAGTSTGSLRELTAGLDDAAGRHVLDAFAHRLGWHESSITHLVTGDQVGGPARTATPAPAPLPTFEDTCRNAHVRLGDAADWLRTRHHLGAGPQRHAQEAIHRALAAIGTAKAAVHDAATARSRAATHHRVQARMRAEAESAQYPDTGND